MTSVAVIVPCRDHNQHAGLDKVRNGGIDHGIALTAEAEIGHDGRIRSTLSLHHDVAEALVDIRPLSLAVAIKFGPWKPAGRVAPEDLARGRENAALAAGRGLPSGRLSAPVLRSGLPTSPGDSKQ